MRGGLVSFSHTGDPAIERTPGYPGTATVRRSAIRHAQPERRSRNWGTAVKTLFDNLTTSLFIVGLNGEIIVWNRPLSWLLGYSGRSFPAGKWTSIIAPTHAPAFAPALERVRSGEHIRIFTALLHSDGRLIPAEVNLRRIVYKNRPILLAEVTGPGDSGAGSYHSQLQGLPIPVLVWRKTGTGFLLAGWNESADSDSGGEIVHDWGKPAEKYFHGSPEIVELMHRCTVERRRMELDTVCRLWNKQVRLHLTLFHHPPDTVYLYIQDITSRALTEERLRECQDALRTLSAELTLAEQNERRAIAADIHDCLNQTLALAQFRLDALEAENSQLPLQTELHQVRALIEEAIRETRDLIFSLCPPVLAELGFQAAAQRLAERFQKEQGIPARLVSDGPVIRLDSDIETLLYKALRELLHNVGKHARAGAVTISTWSDRDFFHVAVEDDGVGLDASTSRTALVPKGFGLFSIRERLRCIGGDCVIESAMNQGTRCTLHVPLTKSVS